jgi:beta-lactam-binding protein with PASTA domain
VNGLGITGTILRRIAVVLVLGATFVASAMVTVYALFHSGQVEVPKVVGMSEDEARRAVERAGLEFKQRRVHFDPEGPAGIVTEQDPAPDFPVKSGYEIKVDISKGSDPTGESEKTELPGPTNPSERPANENANRKKKPTNTNGNGNSNAKGNANGNAKPADGPSNKPKPATTNTERDDDKPKPPANKAPDPKPAKPKPPPPAR